MKSQYKQATSKHDQEAADRWGVSVTASLIYRYIFDLYLYDASDAPTLEDVELEIKTKFKLTNEATKEYVDELLQAKLFRLYKGKLIVRKLLLWKLRIEKIFLRDEEEAIKYQRKAKP